MKLRWLDLGLGAPILAAIYAACSSASGGGTNAAGNHGTSSATGGAASFTVTTGGSGFNVSDAGSQFDSVTPTCEMHQCTDFPQDPINTEGIDTSQFGSASGSGPCIIEPQDGTLFPRNWLRPRVNFYNAGSGQKYRLTFHTDREANDLVVYTSKIPWAMPQDVWHNLALNVMEEDITLTVRVAGGGESSVTFRIAPAEAGGTIVFWHTTKCNASADDKSALYGFRPGDEGVVSALTPAQIQTTMLQSSGQVKTTNRVTTPPASGAYALNGSAMCVGCHSSTPDGQAVATTDDWPWNVAISTIDPSSGTVGANPSYVTRAGMMMAQSPWQGVTTFSRGDWSTGARRYVTSFAPRVIEATQGWLFWPGSDPFTKTGQDSLIWVNLAAAGTVPQTTNAADIGAALVGLKGTIWDFIARDGDSKWYCSVDGSACTQGSLCSNQVPCAQRGAVTPNWSHDGTLIAYTSTDSTSDGRVGPNPTTNTPPLTVAEIYTVPFNNGQGGTATPVTGASDPKYGQYYPAFSGDDAYIAFNRAPLDGNALYYRADAQICIVPTTGGADATVIAANNPPSCTGLDTSTIHNSWPKWSPYPKTVNGATYYFMTFSSARYSNYTITKAQGSCASDEPASELFLTVIKVEGTNITTYPGIYLWNQEYLFQTDASGNAVTDSSGNPKYSVELGLNVTPAWDEFIVPTVPPVQVIIN